MLRGVSWTTSQASTEGCTNQRDVTAAKRSRSPRRRHRAGGSHGSSTRRRTSGRRGDDVRIATLLIHERDLAKDEVRKAEAGAKSEHKKRKRLERENADLQRKLTEEIQKLKKTAADLEDAAADRDDAEAENVKMKGELEKSMQDVDDVRKEKEKLAAMLANQKLYKRTLLAQAELTRIANASRDLEQNQNAKLIPVKMELVAFKMKVSAEESEGIVTAIEDSESEYYSDDSNSGSSKDDEETRECRQQQREGRREAKWLVAVKSGMPGPPASIVLPQA
jgi:hypothetical protein